MLIHKCICGGKCEWCETKSEEAGFDRLSITMEQRNRVEEIIGKVMKGVEMKEARAQIPEFICPSVPRPSK